MPIRDEDDIIRSTDSDALSSRLSCFLKGYLPEEGLLTVLIPILIHYKLLSIESEFRRFAVARNLRKEFFNLIDPKAAECGAQAINITRASNEVLKSPVINRGTWLRTVSINMVIDDFLSQNGNEHLQILSLGAGNDTRAFRLLPKYHERLTYFELDFEDSCREKKFSILSSKVLSESLFVDDTIRGEQDLPTDYASFHASSGRLDSSCYHLIPCDLRKLTKRGALPPEFDWNKKTLVLSECCVCYMGTDESNSLLRFLKDNLSQGLFLVYEPMGGEARQESRYGEVMVRNLRTRGIEMPNLMVYNTIRKQTDRFVGFGIASCDLVVCDLKFVNYNWINHEDILRISRLEMLDELEELNLINSHYSLVVTWWGFHYKFPYERQSS